MYFLCSWITMFRKLTTLPLKHALGPKRKTQKCDGNNVLADVVSYNKTINKNPKNIQNKRYVAGTGTIASENTLFVFNSVLQNSWPYNFSYYLRGNNCCP